MGGGCLWDVGVYPLSFAQYIMGGPPLLVFGRQRLGPSGVDEVFTGLLQYEEGRLAQIASAFATPFYTQAEVIGERGRLQITQPFVFDPARGPYRVRFFDVSEKVHEWEVPQADLYLGEVEDMHRAILDGIPPYLHAQESRNHVATVLALYESAQTGRPVIVASDR